MTTPDVLNRLEEIEGDVEASSVYIEEGDALRLREGARYLLRLTRALLESQGELMEWQQAVRRTVLELGSVSITKVNEIAARAEKVRKGEV